MGTAASDAASGSLPARTICRRCQGKVESSEIWGSFLTSVAKLGLQAVSALVKEVPSAQTPLQSGSSGCPDRWVPANPLEGSEITSEEEKQR